MARIRKLYYGIDRGCSEYRMGAFYWPTQEGKRSEYLSAKRNQPAVAEATYQCDPGRLQGDIFLEEDFHFYQEPVHRALGYSACHKFLSTRGEIIVQSWDTAFSADDRRDPSACITALLAPCERSHFSEEKVDLHYDILILDAFVMRLDFGDLEEYAKAQAALWHPNYILIEKKASGEPILQNLKKEGLPVEGVPESKLGKRARALIGTSAGSAQGWMRQGRVMFPARGVGTDEMELDPTISNMIQELKNFSGLTGGRDDQVDAFVHLVNWAILRIANTGALPDNIEATPAFEAPSTPQAAIGALEKMESTNPYGECCEYCRYFSKERKYCQMHKMTTFALNSCEFFDSEEDDEMALLYMGLEENE